MLDVNSGSLTTIHVPRLLVSGTRLTEGSMKSFLSCVVTAALLAISACGGDDDSGGPGGGSGGQGGSGGSSVGGAAGWAGSGGSGGTAGSGGAGASGGTGATGGTGGAAGSGGGPSSDCTLPPSETGAPALPQATVDVSSVIPTGKTISVASGGNLQTAIDQAALGDVIEIAAGAKLTGNFKLPVKSGSGWVVIRSSGASSLPAGKRVSPTDTAKMAVLETATALPVIETADGAHHYRLEGLELRPATGVDVNDLVVFGSASATDPNAQAHHLIIDRCYIHGDPAVGGKRGVRLNSAHTAVIHSYLSDWKRAGQDTQALLGWNGPGPFKIWNNYLEGSGENVMFGGADSKSAAMSPKDIEICKNHFKKPLAWKNESWSVKNLFELKSGIRVLVSGNLFENNWSNAQNGYGILLKSANQDGTAPWSLTQDVTFVYNVLRNSENGFNVTARDPGTLSDVTRRLLISHNVVEPGTERMLQLLNDLKDVWFTHNTAFASYSSISFDSGAGKGTNLVVRDNILGHGSYGVKGSGQATGTGSLDAFWSPWVFSHNVLVLDSATVSQSAYPTGNFFASTNADVGFVSYANKDFLLGAGSPYVGKASDGTNPGADIPKLVAALAGVEQ